MLLSFLAALASAADSAIVLARDGSAVMLELTDSALLPGEAVGVHVSEARPDPRSGALVAGYRYGGDGRIVWTGDGLVQVLLEHPGPLSPGARVRLDAPLGRSPTPPWTPPAPAPDPIALPEPAPTPDPPRRSAPELTLDRVLASDREGRPLGRLREAYPYGGRTQGVELRVDVADDGFGTGTSTGRLAWFAVPDRGPGRVEIAVDGVRGRRWVEPRGAGEPAAREVVAAYGLWTVLESAAVGTAAIGGLGLGVDDGGLALGWTVGLRSGAPWSDHVQLVAIGRGALGAQLAIGGEVAVAAPLRVGARARVGDVPRHDGEGLRQGRADGVLLASADLSDALTLTLAGGLAGYDLALADAGPVVELAMTTRFRREAP